MLELRPTCENCNAALPPDSTDAMICSFECTFCRPCVENILDNVCPNCGGGFCPRPIRPINNWKGGNYLGAYPASTTDQASSRRSTPSQAICRGNQINSTGTAIMPNRAWQWTTPSRCSFNSNHQWPEFLSSYTAGQLEPTQTLWRVLESCGTARRPRELSVPN